ncbi:hypothetical protein [Streptomyces sp. NPDC050548]|uniref:hypothetical protein n=1 Tax=Streptomyces sp. NPDC050548 TaxID=3365629 RepID=UPI0037A38336
MEPIQAVAVRASQTGACIGIPDVTTGELTHFIEQFTIKDGKVIELGLFYNNAGALVDKPKVV